MFLERLADIKNGPEYVYVVEGPVCRKGMSPVVKETSPRRDFASATDRFVTLSYLRTSWRRYGVREAARDGDSHYRAEVHSRMQQGVPHQMS